MNMGAVITVVVGLILLWVIATGNYQRAIDAVNVLIGAKNAT